MNIGCDFNPNRPVGATKEMVESAFGYHALLKNTLKKMVIAGLVENIHKKQKIR